MFYRLTLLAFTYFYVVYP